jgi:hypothetical protein
MLSAGTFPLWAFSMPGEKIAVVKNNWKQEELEKLCLIGICGLILIFSANHRYCYFCGSSRVPRHHSFPKV